MEDKRTKQELLEQIEQQNLIIQKLEQQLHQVSQSSEKDLEHRLAITINNIPLAILNTDRHGYITAANPAFLKIFDKQSNELIDRQNIKFFEPFQKTELHHRIIQLIDHLTDFDIELPFPETKKDAYFRCRGLSIKSRISEGLSFLIIIGDVSKRKLTEHELIKALQKAEESDKLKTAFLASMSHEIRTPMNHIIGFTEFMKDLSLPAYEREEYADIIFDSGQILLRLIDDIIDIAKIESGQMQLHISVFALNEVLFSVFKSFNEMRGRKGKEHINFLLSLPETEASMFMKTDAVRLQQIFYNLIDNAFKFTESGSISIGYTIEDDNVTFFIQDSGPGITVEQQEHIFKRFRQLDYGLTKKYGGTGLGLAIVKGLIDLLEGQIQVWSEPEKGTRFTFQIPGLIVQSTARQSKAIPVTSLSNWSNYTILIVEDERTNYNLLMIMLRPSKVKIIWAKNGKEAIDLMEENKAVIDLVLMDIRLPLINGYDATKAIKRIKTAVPVIAQTAYAMDVEIQTAMEAGCDGYITKPIERNLLIDTIASHLPPK
ncbi:MAG: PAS/PAC sensor hybrid histidine kinase [Bacteroidetes bacterium]|nr:MAG: PAS/PAC sensor hybrid histidine kinase [Bacteroidota bacterium]